jgi:glycosyltransferase involved in cell wall biosynthesis
VRRRRRRGTHLVEVGLVWPPETFVQWKLERLAARGYRVTVAGNATRREARARLDGVALARQPSPWEESKPRMVAGVLLDALLLALTHPRRLRPAIEAARHPLRTRRSASRWATLARVRSHLPVARLSPDVVHFEWNSSAIHYMPMLRAWGCPAVVSCHGSDLNIRPFTGDGELWSAYLERTFARADAVHCVSQALVDLGARFGLDPAKTWLIRPAVDPRGFRPAPGRARGDQMRVAAVGDFRWLKGHEYALRAIRLLIDAGVPAHLEVIGGDPHGAVGEESNRRRLEHTVADLGLEGNVTLAGRVPSAEVARRLAESDALLHMSLSEGIPTAVLEAMASGLPVVAADCGGMREAVTDGEHGLVVALRESGAAAEALAELWRDPARAARMGAAGRERVIAEFALDDQIDRYAEMYEHVTAGGGADRHASPPEPAPPPVGTGAPGPGALRLVSTAPLEWESGYEYAIHAVALLAERGVDCEYAITGQGPYRDALLFARHQMGVTQRVLLTDGEAPGPAADLFVDASVAGAPRPVPAGMEAVVASGPGAVARRDPHALADAIAARARAPR